ncbi:MAG: BACON domain-containing protein [Desulfobulbaceae bacterium]
MRKRTLGAMTLNTLLVLILAGMGFTPGGAVQAASMPAYEVLPALDVGVDSPAAVAVDRQGRIYVAEQADNRVRIFAQGGNLLAQIINLAGAKSVAVDDGGNIYIGSQSGSQGKVAVFDSARTLVGNLAGEFLNPTDIDIHGGQVYVTDKGNGLASGSVRVYDSAGQLVKNIGTPGNGEGQLWHPTTLAIDPVASEILILDRQQVFDKGSGKNVDGVRLQYFNMDGTIKRGYVMRDTAKDPMANPAQVMSPVQLTVDAASRIYITDNMRQEIMVFDNVNNHLGKIADKGPRGLCMTETGRLYVASSYYGRVDVFGVENYAAMNVNPATLSFTATEGVVAPAPQDATVVNSGKADVTWTAATTTDWVTLPSTTGTLPTAATETVPVEVSHDGLAPGTYKGSVTVTAPGMEEVVTVNLTVQAAALQVSPASLLFTASEGSTPTAQVLSISNGSSEPLSWSASADQAWLALSKTAGTAPNTVNVYADTTGLTVGSYTGSITFLNLAGGKSVNVAVTLNIGGATAPPSDAPALPLPGQGAVQAGGKNWSAKQPVPGIALRGVWGNGTRNLLAVGDGGTILSYNGREWKAVSSGTESALQSIWGSVTDSGADIYTVGEKGMLLHSSGRGWSPVATNTTEDLADIWGAGAEVIAAGNNGTILNLTQSSSKNENYVLRSIWGSSAADFFAVGESGTVLHSDGTTWTTMTSDTTQWLNAIWGDPQTGEVFAVGENGTIIHYDGTTWNAMTSGVSVSLHGIYGTAADNLYAVGDSGVVLHYDGATWSVLLAGGISLRDVWADDRQVVAVGDDGLILVGMGSSQRKKGSRGAMNKGLLAPALKGPATR